MTTASVTSRSLIFPSSSPSNGVGMLVSVSSPALPSAIWEFRTCRKWRRTDDGVVAHPEEERFEGIIFERAAITPTPNARQFFHIKEHAGDRLPFQRQVGSLRREYVLKTMALMRRYRFQGPVRDDLETSVVSVDVPCLTFDELVAKHGVHRVDFVDIDAEGCDYELFCSIDFGRYRPAVLCLETVELSPEQDREVRIRLERLGCHFLERFDLYSEIFIRS